MRILFDTSVLVPALIAELPRHELAASLLREAHRGTWRLHVAAHALAELYATLTAIPVSPRITPGQARELIRRNVERRAEIVTLDAGDYAAVLDRMTALGLSGGAVYDALHVRAAEKAGAERLYTFNGRDFRRMPPAPPTELIVP